MLLSEKHTSRIRSQIAPLVESVWESAVLRRQYKGCLYSPGGFCVFAIPIEANEFLFNSLDGRPPGRAELARNVDAADAATHLREYLTRAGDRDITIKTYPNAGHQLIVSKSGYNGEPAPPERFVSGYPQITITWLAERGFTM
jgi:hypothetical protein